MISRQITGSGSDTALVNLVTPPQPLIASLGAVAADVLAKSPSAVSLAVSLALAAVFVGATGAADGTVASSITFHPTGPTRALAGWRAALPGFTGGDFAVGALTASTPGSLPMGQILKDVFDPELDPTFSIGGLIDRIDRAYQALGTQPADVLIIIDQNNEQVTVQTFSVAPTMVAGTITATFEAATPVPAGAQWGE